MGGILTNLSIISNLFEDYPASAQAAAEAISIFQSLGDEDHQAFPKRMLAYALLYQGLPSRARMLAKESLNANLTLGSAQGLGVLSSIVALTDILRVEGKLEVVARLYGFLKPRITQNYKITSPDARAFDRIILALKDADTEDWQTKGASMTLEQAIELASRQSSPKAGGARRKPIMRRGT
jgi:hypothetical protein